MAIHNNYYYDKKNDYSCRVLSVECVYSENEEINDPLQHFMKVRVNGPRKRGHKHA